MVFFFLDIFCGILALVFQLLYTAAMRDFILSHDIVSGSDIMPYNKIYKPQVIYRLVAKVMTSFITLRKIWQDIDIFTPENAIFK